MLDRCKKHSRDFDNSRTVSGLCPECETDLELAAEELVPRSELEALQSKLNALNLEHMTLKSDHAREVFELTEQLEDRASRLSTSELEQEHQRQCAVAWFEKFQELCAAAGIAGASGLEHERAVATISSLSSRLDNAERSRDSNVEVVAAAGRAIKDLDAKLEVCREALFAALQDFDEIGLESSPTKHAIVAALEGIVVERQTPK